MRDAITTENKSLCKLLEVDGLKLNIIDKNKIIRSIDFLIPMQVGSKKCHIDIIVEKSHGNSDLVITTRAYEDKYYRITRSIPEYLKTNYYSKYTDIIKETVVINSYDENDILQERKEKFSSALTEAVEPWIWKLIEGTLYEDLVNAASWNIFNKHEVFNIILSDFICNTAIVNLGFTETSKNNNDILLRIYKNHMHGNTIHLLKDLLNKQNENMHDAFDKIYNNLLE